MNTKIINRDVPCINHNLTNLHPILQRVYLSRGIDSCEKLDKELSNLIKFELLENINEAINLILQHISNKSKILIIGDFDGDGATSTTLAVDFFRQLGVNIDYLVPNRFEYGYGLSVELVNTAREYNPDLLITVDSGIACLPGVARARELGMDVLVTDHHLPGKTLPQANCIVNPNLVTDKFPSKNLAGVGVIFYVLLALRSKLRDENWFDNNNIKPINMAQFLDLVALGTVTDVVPLDYNNRILVENGIKRIRNGQCRIGIKALLKISKRRQDTIVASDLGFSVGPRLNAAGRLDDMSLGIECLLAKDPMVAFNMAENLDALNIERKNIEREMKAEALSIINNLDIAKDDEKLPLAFCLYNESWHQGVIGIVAARIKELYNRPVIVFAEDNEEYIKGSCRSIDGVNMRDVLQDIATSRPDILKKFGGHAMAAGLSLKKSDLKLFNTMFIDQVATVLKYDDICGLFETDGVLDVKDINLELAGLLQYEGPWGQKFPEPIFNGEFIITEQRILGDQHMALKLQPDDDSYKGGNIDGIIFNCKDTKWFNLKLFKVQLVYKLSVNEYNKQIKLQLLIDYLQPI